MLQVKVYRLNKSRESIPDFEKRVNEWVHLVGDVSMSVSESLYTGDLVFVFSYNLKKSVNQELRIIGWFDLETLESAINNALFSIQESGQLSKSMNVVTTAKSIRALAAFIVEVNRPNLSSRPEQSLNETTKANQETKQNETNHAKPKQGRKSKVVL